MKINIVALALAAGLFWGATILVVGSASVIWPGYGRAFLDFVASLYPGYRPGPAFGSVVTGTLYSLVDGTIAGAVFGWLYNSLSRFFPGGSA
jgi:hypothetical protein